MESLAILLAIGVIVFFALDSKNKT